MNRYMAQREEDDLTEYVQRQLTRSRSGHRLVRDVETGALTNKHSANRSQASQGQGQGNSQGQSGHGGRSTDYSPSEPDVFGTVSADSAVDGSMSPLQSPTMRSPPPHHLHCDLEQILEEEGSDRMDEGRLARDLMAPSPASAFSPGMSPGMSPGSGPDTPSETKELLHHHQHLPPQQHVHYSSHHSHHMVAI